MGESELANYQDFSVTDGKNIKINLTIDLTSPEVSRIIIYLT